MDSNQTWYEPPHGPCGLTSPKGDIILENLKNPNFPLMAQDGGRNPVVAPFVATFAHFLEEEKKGFQIEMFFF